MIGLERRAPITNPRSVSRIRPLDAAGLVLLRRSGRKKFEVLMGRRHARASFMPGIYVFPGGCTEPTDSRLSGFPESISGPYEGIDQATHRRLIPLVRAAIRETWEETGLLVAEAQSAIHFNPDAQAPAWRAFAVARLQPAFSALKLIGRAITPTESPIRFHTRFFVADGSLAKGKLGGDGELEDLRWVTVSETRGLPMVGINRFILAEAVARFFENSAPPALYFHRGGRIRVRNATSGFRDFHG